MLLAKLKEKNEVNDEEEIIIVIHKIMEWDKKRKFGCRFGDFILLLCCVIIINLIAVYITHKINVVLMILSVAVYAVLVNRSSPEY